MPTPTDGAAPDSNQSGTALATEFQNFIADIEDLLKSTSSLTGADFEQAKKKLAERVEAAKTSVQDIGENVATKALHSAETTDRYVHQKPWQSIAACAAVSFVLGVLVARK